MCGFWQLLRSQLVLRYASLENIVRIGRRRITVAGKPANEQQIGNGHVHGQTLRIVNNNRVVNHPLANGI